MEDKNKEKKSRTMGEIEMISAAIVLGGVVALVALNLLLLLIPSEAVRVVLLASEGTILTLVAYMAYKALEDAIDRTK